jgi:3-isopropylmalate/(R)-2-methylmalate dehydratase large subunit
MSPILPARLKNGVPLDSIAGPDSKPGRKRRRSSRIRGRALIFWDAEHLGKKRDAIDTDQITPAADCVSESLDRLDERWKAGAFRHLMPDFRERVHRGETFLIAGDRFAIGSSREMSPAGLKGVAEEVRLQLVIVCGANMGEIFRRNAINLGLHVVQCPEAVDDARDDDVFTLDTSSRKLVNVSRKRSYRPVPLTDKEEAIRTAGGILAVARREFPASLRMKPRVVFPDPDEARKMTLAEQIVWAHRVDRDASLEPGSTLTVYADLLPASDGTAPFAIHTFNQVTGGRTIHPRQAALLSDHFVFTGKWADDRQTAISRGFARQHGIEEPFYAAPGDGIFHLYLPERGMIVPGGFYAGGDSHSRAYGAYGAVGVGVGSTTIGCGWSLGYVHFTPARQRRVVFEGALQPWVSGKDIVLELLRRWGEEQAGGMGVEFVDARRQLPMTYRNTIANMMAEAEAQNGIFAQDAITEAWYRERGIELEYPALAPGVDARFERDETLDLNGVVPMIARPFCPGNAHPAEQVARERVTFQKALIGSCTNGSYDDLLAAALVLRAARLAGHGRVAPGVALLVFPGSGRVGRQIERPETKLGGESIAEIFRAIGGEVRESWCGPCFGQGPDALRSNERAITSFNRNWQNRMGVGGEGYLASPAVVAASAVVGYMAPPSELGLTWSPDAFGA